MGQLFIFGIPGKKLDERTKAHLRETGPSAFILFKRNLSSNKQVAELTNDLQRFAADELGHSVFVGIDQEGGRVTRIPFFPALPSALAIGQTNSTELAEGLGYQVGRALKQLGFSINFAPVLDLGNETQYSFLGQRSFASDPDSVARLGSAYGRGLLKAGVLPIAKHFPGIGPIPNDPHISLVRRNISRDEIEKRDLKPFREFIPIQPSGLMISHLIYPHLDKDTPGTYSKKIVQGLLREELGYQGLIVTDDLMMEGAQGGKVSFEENIVRAFEAGADLMMISWSERRQKIAIKALEKALESGRIREEDVHMRLNRILAAKAAFRLNQPARALDDRNLLVYGFKDYEQLLSRVLNESIRSQQLSPGADRLLSLQSQSAGIRAMNLNSAQTESLSFSQVLLRLGARDRAPASSSSMTNFLMVIRNRADDQLAAQIPESLRPQVLLVNLWRPDRKSGAFPKSFELFLSHPDRDKLIGAWINNWLNQVPSGQTPAQSQRSDVSLPFEPYPNPRRTGIRSQGDSRMSSADLGLLSR